VRSLKPLGRYKTGKMKKTEAILQHYESEDFKSNYAHALLERFHDNEGDILNRIQEIFNIRNYEVNNFYGETVFIDRDTARKIHEFIAENFEEFIDTFSSYYVGYTSLDSVSYGEQHEQIEEEEREEFEEAGFIVNDSDKTSAYYDMSANGLHVDLINEKLKQVLKDNNLLK
jgi:hypothetical protein